MKTMGLVGKNGFIYDEYLLQQNIIRIYMFTTDKRFNKETNFSEKNLS